MATNDQTEHWLGQTPLNDNLGDDTTKSMAPNEIRVALCQLVQLLARRAAREWLAKEANDNTPRKSKPILLAPSPEDTCNDNHE